MSRTSPKATPAGIWIGLGLLLLLAFALRTFNLGTQDIWWDEARNIFTASRPLNAIASAKELDIHPPLYFYLMHIWIVLAGTSEFVVRYFSLWFGVTELAIAYRLGCYLKDQYVGLWAAFLVALSPFLVDEAQQTRMYTLLIFISTISMYLLLRALNTRQRKYWIAYALAAAASFYVHYSFVYVLAAQNVYLFFKVLATWRTSREWRPLFSVWVTSQAIIGFLYLFQLPNILRQMQIYGNPGMTPPLVSQYITDLARAFLLGQKIDIGAADGIALATAVALFLTLIAVFIRRDDSLSHRYGGIILSCFLVPLIAYYVVLQKSPQFTPRYIIVAAPPFYFLLALFLAKLSRRSLLIGAMPLLLLSFAYTGALQSMYFNPSFFSEDTRGLAQFVSSAATKDDLVLIDVPFPFDYYYHGAAQAQYLFVDIHSTADVLTALAQGKRRLFWITWYKSDTDPRGYVPYLLSKYAVYSGEQDFRGYNVSWYELPQVPRFSLAPAPQPSSALFADRLALDRFAYGGVVTPNTPNADEPCVAVGSKLWVALWWKIIQPVQKNYTVSVVLRDASGNTAAQEDRRLLSDRHLTTRFWNIGEEAINVYVPELEQGVGPGEYTLNAIVYDPETGKRLGIGDGDTLKLGELWVIPVGADK